MRPVYSIFFALFALPAAAETIIVQSTTSTANSGLYDHILPAFEEVHDIEVRVVAVGTGQAIRNAENCDGDVLLVHAKAAEQEFVRNGGGVSRHDLMYNDFVLVGPADDPAGVAGLGDIVGALSRIAETGANFASRSDDSGTHKKEMSLWSDVGLDPVAASGTWYLETGSGMGATLNTGIGVGAYVLTDRATWITFGNKKDFAVIVEGDPRLFNQYGVILINPAACPSVEAGPGQLFIDWLLSDDGQDTIASYRVDDQQLFFPNAGGDG